MQKSRAYQESPTALEGLASRQGSSWRVALSFWEPQFSQGCLHEENPRATRLGWVEIVIKRPQSLLVELDGARPTASANSPAGVVDFDRMLEVPCFAVIAGDDEFVAPLLVLPDPVDNGRQYDPAVAQNSQVIAGNTKSRKDT